jgi:DNA repair exonuclease SbcCD ATPase subunit
MKILDVSWKNFNSYGNTIQRIDFDNDKGDLFLLLGGNGHGKSTIAEVITFALYGKIERKNKNDLPNRINKNLWCKITIKAKGKKIEIERGVSPGLFDVKIDGVTYDTAGNTNVQDYLELEMFDIPYQVFKNIIVLSINDFRSFLTMSPGDKRNIIDRLFGFTIINQMKDSIRSERKDLRDLIKTISDELGIIEESIVSINEKIVNLEEAKKEDKTKIVQEYKQKIIELLIERKQLVDDVTKFKTLEEKMTKAFAEKKDDFTELGFELKNLDTKIKLYENSQCPTCGSDLHTDEHHTSAENAKSEREEKVVTFNSLQEDLRSNQTKIKTVSDKIREMDSKIFKINLLTNQYKNEIEKAVEETKELDADYLKQLVEENQSKKIEKKSKHTEISTEDGFLETVEAVLGEDGVKNLAMKTILPSLNVNIANMSKQMHLPYSIKFNDKFDCIVNALGEEINPRSMSTGERKKADFIIIIALLKILKIRYPSLNILFLDEIFSSVDSAGVYEIVKILSEIAKENKLNTWVINHTELPMELFDKRVEAVKEGGFSKLNIENIT